MDKVKPLKNNTFFHLFYKDYEIINSPSQTERLINEIVELIKLV